MTMESSETTTEQPTYEELEKDIGILKLEVQKEFWTRVKLWVKEIPLPSHVEEFVKRVQATKHAVDAVASATE